MTNPPSVASQGSGGAQTYPKGILKKSVQAAFEGERPTIYHHNTSTSTTSFLRLPSVPARLCSCVCVCVSCVSSVLSPSALAGPWHGVCVLLTESYCGSESPATGPWDDEPSFALCDSLAANPY